FRDFSPSLRDALFLAWDPWPAVEEIFRVLTTHFRNDLKALVARLLPARVREEFQAYLALDAPACRVLLGRRFARSLGLSKPNRLATAPHNIVFVCHGNIMRSALAEARLKQICKARLDISISSAGLHAIGGRQADPRAIKIGPQFGVSLKSHRATPL